MIVRQPLELVQMAERFDITVKVVGGGITGEEFFAPENVARIMSGAGVAA